MLASRILSRLTRNLWAGKFDIFLSVSKKVKVLNSIFNSIIEKFKEYK